MYTNAFQCWAYQIIPAVRPNSFDLDPEAPNGENTCAPKCSTPFRRQTPRTVFVSWTSHLSNKSASSRSTRTNWLRSWFGWSPLPCRCPCISDWCATSKRCPLSEPHRCSRTATGAERRTAARWMRIAANNYRHAVPTRSCDEMRWTYRTCRMCTWQCDVRTLPSHLICANNGLCLTIVRAECCELCTYRI